MNIVPMYNPTMRVEFFNLSNQEGELVDSIYYRQANNGGFYISASVTEMKKELKEVYKAFKSMAPTQAEWDSLEEWQADRIKTGIAA